MSFLSKLSTPCSKQIEQAVKKESDQCKRTADQEESARQNTNKMWVDKVVKLEEENKNLKIQIKSLEEKKINDSKQKEEAGYDIIKDTYKVKVGDDLFWKENENEQITHFGIITDIKNEKNYVALNQTSFDPVWTIDNTRYKPPTYGDYPKFYKKTRNGGKTKQNKTKQNKTKRTRRTKSKSKK
jgi:hypothetical protein